MPPRRQVRGDSPMHEKREKTGRNRPGLQENRQERSGVQRWRVCPGVRALFHEGGPRVPDTRGPRGQSGSLARTCGAARREPTRPPSRRCREWGVQGGRHPWGKTRGHGQQVQGQTKPPQGRRESGSRFVVVACCRETLFLGSFDVCSSAEPARPRLHLGKPPATPTRRCITSSMRRATSLIEPPRAASASCARCRPRKARRWEAGRETTGPGGGARSERRRVTDTRLRRSVAARAPTCVEGGG